MVSTRTATALNVTNGDAVIYLFKKAGILGTHVPWRDVLHEGPVPPLHDLTALSGERARYLAQRGYGSAIKLLHDFETRDAALLKAGDYEEVVLWFEHDLYDQLQIAQVLSVLEALRLEAGRVTLVQSDAYLGSMTADEISALHPKRKTITLAGFNAALRAWEGLVSGDTERLNQLARADFAQLPFMRGAFARLLEEFPWTDDGLGRSQRQALSAVAGGPARDEELFRRAQGREEAPFLGDAAFYAVLRDLAAGPAPLIEATDPGYDLTALGRRVLGGDTNWLEHAPQDRWVGGFHIDSASGRIARYDERTERLV